VRVVGHGLEQFEIIDHRPGHTVLVLVAEADHLSCLVLHQPTAGLGQPDQFLGVGGGGGQGAAQRQRQGGDDSARSRRRTVLSQRLAQGHRPRRVDADQSRVRRPGRSPSRVDEGAAAKRQGVDYLVDRPGAFDFDVTGREIGSVVNFAAVGQGAEGAGVVVFAQIAHAVAGSMDADPEATLRGDG
jgi:hypothetical protein